MMLGGMDRRLALSGQLQNQPTQQPTGQVQLEQAPAMPAEAPQQPSQEDLMKSPKYAELAKILGMYMPRTATTGMNLFTARRGGQMSPLAQRMQMGVMPQQSQQPEMSPMATKLMGA